MSDKMDTSQYGNMTGLPKQHYLMKMLHQLRIKLDKNYHGDICAVLAAMIDWKQAFLWQDPKLEIVQFALRVKPFWQTQKVRTMS